jgi:hypothetical protein
MSGHELMVLSVHVSSHISVLPVGLLGPCHDWVRASAFFFSHPTIILFILSALCLYFWNRDCKIPIIFFSTIHYTKGYTNWVKKMQKFFCQEKTDSEFPSHGRYSANVDSDKHHIS